MAPAAAPIAASKSELQQAIAIGQKNAQDVAVLNKTLDGIGKGIEALTKRLESTPAYGSPGVPDPRAIFGGNVPNIRRGENPMSSRGYSFSKMIGMVTGRLRPDQAKIEADIGNRLANCYAEGDAAYTWGVQAGTIGQHKMLAPLSTGFMHDAFVPNEFRSEMKAMTHAGTDGSYDLPDEMRWVRNKMFERMGYQGKTLSWLNELAGGGLVPPAQQGELIELLRNKEALINAGARTVPLPPQGRIQYPRQTTAGQTFWLGENAPGTFSDIGTGVVTLQAKKLAVFMRMPNELIRFASPATEALVRDDMTKDLALGLDLAGLEGQGGDARPLGVLYQPGVTQISSTLPGPGVVGDSIVGNDIYRFPAAVEEANAKFEGFIMRPKTMYKYFQLRADAVGQGDKAGVFLFNLIREAGDGVKPSLAGYPVTTSTQVSTARTKTVGSSNSSANLTYIVGGMWSDLLIGMFGAIEFAATTLGDTAFLNDQTWVRGILSADITLRHAAAFVYMDVLDPTL